MPKSKSKDLLPHKHRKFNFPIRVGNWKALTTGTRVRVTIDGEITSCSATTGTLSIRTDHSLLHLSPDKEVKEIRFLKKRPEPWKTSGGLPRP